MPGFHLCHLDLSFSCVCQKYNYYYVQSDFKTKTSLSGVTYLLRSELSLCGFFVLFYQLKSLCEILDLGYCGLLLKSHSICKQKSDQGSSVQGDPRDKTNNVDSR